MGPLESYLDAPMPFVDPSGEVRTQFPFRCPSDPDRGLPRGISYDQFISGMHLQRFDPFPWKHRMMTDEFEQNMIQEVAPGWHGPGPNQERHNAVYVDGHCDWTGPLRPE